MLIAANELLRYRPVDGVYEEWLDRVAELVRTAGGSPPPSIPLHRTLPRTGNEAPAAPRLPPPQEVAMAPWRMAPGRNPLVRCQRSKNRAAKKSLARQKLPGRSLLQHVATIPCSSMWGHARPGSPSPKASRGHSRLPRLHGTTASLA